MIREYFKQLFTRANIIWCANTIKFPIEYANEVFRLRGVNYLINKINRKIKIPDLYLW